MASEPDRTPTCKDSLRAPRISQGIVPSESETAYRKRAETADLILTEQPPRTTIREVVFWVGEGYGGGDSCNSMDHAMERARGSMRLGYGRNGKTAVHIIETTTRIIEVSIGGDAAYPITPTNPGQYTPHNS